MLNIFSVYDAGFLKSSCIGMISLQFAYKMNKSANN